jgi:16S rRNA (uracil1498-N3)-methyltransferase
MGAPLFLVPALPPAGLFTLDGPEGRHACVVMRLQAGDALWLGDGRGGLASAVVTAALRDRLQVTVVETSFVEPAEPRMVVVQGIAKGDRGELAVQAMTEVGVDEIVPWSAVRSVVQWRGDRGDRSHQRWVDTAREASKQARRSWLPSVPGAATTKAVAARLAQAQTALVLHEEASEPLTTVELSSSGEVVLVVGPEGGVAPDELALFRDAGATAVRLGSTVLRTSTAGVAALSVLSARLGRWSALTLPSPPP